MKIVKSIKDLKNYLSKERQDGRKIGLVPTMGALHEGHLSLVRCCVDENDVCVASIFVNPTQFNDKKDLVAYPRTPEKDHALLESAGCDYIFEPDVEEMYPEPDTRQFNLGRVSEVMEGFHRPGHFNGVAQIVSKLFYVAEPDKAYFGEKDFQQVAVIRAMVRELDIPVEIRTCPILRETDGLAMSSRNMRLTADQRQKVPVIARTLKESANFVTNMTVQQLKEFVVCEINNVSALCVEYFEIVDGDTLESITNWADTAYPVGCIAVYCGEVRLIDNIKY